MFLKRNVAKEIMDDFSIADSRIDSALYELRIINKFLGGTLTSLKGIGKIINSLQGRKNISILDVGAGGSDIFNSKPTGRINTKPFSVDLNKKACLYIKKTTYSNSINADAFKLPFKDKSFDIVHASLFFHHFNEEEIYLLLKQFKRISRHGIVINDLHRSILALSGIKILTKLFSKSEMVLNDAPLSVKKGFLKRELKNLLSEAGFANSSVTWNWAFRWLVIINVK